MNFVRPRKASKCLEIFPVIFCAIVATLIAWPNTWNSKIAPKQKKIDRRRSKYSLSGGRPGSPDSVFCSGTTPRLHGCKSRVALERETFSRPPKKTTCSFSYWFRAIRGFRVGSRKTVPTVRASVRGNSEQWHCDPERLAQHPCHPLKLGRCFAPPSGWNIESGFSQF